MSRIAIYTRVSTDDQAKEGFSLKAQEEVLRSYCELFGHEVVNVYSDEGYSGRNIKRPAYQQMMADIDSWDAILVLKMDRIHRNTRNFFDMMEFLEKKKKNFISQQETLDTNTAMGHFVMLMIQGIAQLESEQNGERTKDGMKRKAETLETNDDEKRTMGFNPPFGYRISEGKLVDDPEEQVIVSEIFESYNSGETLDSISYHLNTRHITTRKGNPWNKFNLRTILHNPVYAGYMHWEDILIKHDATPVVSPEQFNRIQEKMASKVRDPSKRKVEYVPVYDDVDGVSNSDLEIDI